jgi:hypothetical protein
VQQKADTERYEAALEALKVPCGRSALSCPDGVPVQIPLAPPADPSDVARSQRCTKLSTLTDMLRKYNEAEDLKLRLLRRLQARAAASMQTV